MSYLLMCASCVNFKRQSSECPALFRRRRLLGRRCIFVAATDLLIKTQRNLECGRIVISEYILPKSYGPISLLFFLLKALSDLFIDTSEEKPYHNGLHLNHLPLEYFCIYRERFRQSHLQYCNGYHVISHTVQNCRFFTLLDQFGVHTFPSKKHGIERLELTKENRKIVSGKLIEGKKFKRLHFAVFIRLYVIIDSSLIHFLQKNQFFI